FFFVAVFVCALFCFLFFFFFFSSRRRHTRSKRDWSSDVCSSDLLHHFMDVPEIQGLIPLYAFVFLVVLGEDYNIFLVSSIWKKRKEMPLKQAIQESVGETG